MAVVKCNIVNQLSAFKKNFFTEVVDEKTDAILMLA